MSKIGKLPITIPAGVEVTIEGRRIKVKGPLGSLEREFPRGVEFVQKENELEVSIKKTDKTMRAIHGTARAIVANMVNGCSVGWVKELELIGTGYRAEVQGKTIVLTVGFSIPVKIEAPEGITFKVEKSFITVSGIDREVVGQIAAEIKRVRPPEPYQGKGIRFKGEIIKKKAGKAAKAGEA